MNDDLDNKNDDYDRRLFDSGGPPAIIRELMHGVKQQHRIIEILVLSIAIEFVLIIVLGLTILQINSNTKQVDDNTDNIRANQERTDTEVLCPLFEVFIEAFDTPPPAAGDRNHDGVVSANEQQFYSRATLKIRAAYAELECN